LISVVVFVVGEFLFTLEESKKKASKEKHF